MTLREKAPEGLIPWIREQKDIDWVDYLIYKAGWSREPITGLTSPCAEAVCTACGKRMTLERAYNVRCRSGNASFGVGWATAEGYRACGSGKETNCPACGKTVTVLHTSAAGNLHRFVWPMSLERVGEDLVCYMWRVERSVGKDGAVRFGAVPWEAAVFGEKKAGAWKHWTGGMFGQVYESDWHGLSEMKDRFFDIELVYCPEGIAAATKGSCMENSKLELYMAVKGEHLFPIVWLRLYQRRREKAESLMTCGAAKLTAGIIAEEKKASGYGSAWTTRLACLQDLDWKKKKPAEILRLSKQEIPYFTERERTDGVHRLRVIQEARKKGIALRPGDEAGQAMSRNDQLALLENGITPSFVTRYLARQKRRYKTDASFWYLEDYWNMAKKLGITLSEREERFPQNLKGKHDELVERINEIREEKRRRDAEQRAGRFTERCEAMSRYRWEKDGILIRPAASEAELRAEGKALHHCVATYAARHAAGELTIFFIRRTTAPDEPWFTLNFNEKTRSVTENRGLRNCARTPEIEAFEKAWLAWVRAGCKQKGQEVHAA